MTQAVSSAPVQPMQGQERAPRLMRQPQAAAGGAHPIGYGLFILVNATLFIRPGEIVPALDNWSIYLWLIAACAACSLPVLVEQLKWSYLARNPAILCIVMLVPAVFLSHASHGDLWSARYGALEFAKVVLYFLLLIGLVNSPERLNGFLALTVVFITITAVLAILNYHEIFSLATMNVLERPEGIDVETGELETFQQLQATGIFSDPNDLAVILVTAILGSFHLLMDTRNWLKKGAWLVIVPILLYAFALTKSRGGFLSLSVGIMAFLFARLGWKKAVMIGLVLLPVLVAAFAGRQTSINVTDTNDTAYGRVLLWREGLMLFKQSPIFGIGQNMYGEEAEQVAHNSYVHAFAELGFFGGTLFLAAFLTPIFSCLRIKLPGTSAATKSLSTIVFAMISAYAIGILSLSRGYSNATYLVLGIACAFCAMGRAEGANWMTFDWRFVKRAALAGIAMLAFVTVFVRVVT